MAGDLFSTRMLKKCPLDFAGEKSDGCKSTMCIVSSFFVLMLVPTWSVKVIFKRASMHFHSYNGYLSHRSVMGVKGLSFFVGKKGQQYERASGAKALFECVCWGEW